MEADGGDDHHTVRGLVTALTHSSKGYVQSVRLNCYGVCLSKDSDGAKVRARAWHCSRTRRRVLCTTRGLIQRYRGRLKILNVSLGLFVKH